VREASVSGTGVQDIRECRGGVAETILKKKVEAQFRGVRAYGRKKGRQGGTLWGGRERKEKC